MFSKTAEEKINLAIIAETSAACNKYGDVYNSLHEGYAVLKEEVDEVRDQQIHIKNNIFDLWDKVKTNDVPAAKGDIEAIRKHAEKLALEAVQVCAVCEKLLKSI